MSLLERKIIKIHAKSGAVLDKCIQECISLSFTEGVDVELIHNEVSIIIKWGSLLNKVYQDNAKPELVITLH